MAELEATRTSGECAVAFGCVATPMVVRHCRSLSTVEVIHNCSILAAVGLRMASTPGVSATLFDALAKANINVRAISQGCSEYNITVVLKQEDCVRALRAAHSRFFLSKTTLAVGIIGPGLIGQTLLNQLKDQTAVLKENMNIDLRVMGITGTRTMLLSDAARRGNNRGVSGPPADTLLLLQLAVADEEDDATSKLVVPRSPLPMPPSRQSHGHRQGGQNLNPKMQVQVEAVAGGATVSQQSLDQQMQGDIGGELPSVSNAMFNDQMYYIDHELSIDDFLHNDDYKINLPGSNPDGLNNLQGIGQLEHQQFDLSLELPPPNSYVDANNSAQNTADIFFPHARLAHNNVSIAFSIFGAEMCTLGLWSTCPRIRSVSRLLQPLPCWFGFE